MYISPVFDGYSYGVPESSRQTVFEYLSQLYNQVLNTDKQISSTDSQLYPNTLSEAQAIHSTYTNFLNSIFEGNIPVNSSVMYLLAPPGNRYPVINMEDINTTSQGLVWNVWAAYEQYLHPNENINNYWNNTYAQGILPTEFSGNPYATPPTPTSTSNYLHPEDLSAAYPNFATVPITTGSPASSGNDYNPNNLDYRISVYPNNTSQSFKNFITQSIYDFRTLGENPVLLAVKSTAGSFIVPLENGQNATFGLLPILKHPSVQDVLFYEYTRTGESQLQREISLNTDQISVADDALAYLYVLNKVLSEDLNVDRKMTPIPSNTFTSNGIPLYEYNASLWNLRNYLVSGYSQLRILYSRGILTDEDTKSMINSVINIFSKAASLIKYYNAHVNQKNAASAYKAMSNILMGKGWGDNSTSINANKSTNAVNSLISQLQNWNTSLKQDLKTAVYVYQQFVESAAKMLSATQTTLRSIIQDIAPN